jgi:type IV pilus assembly protein PilM
MAMGQWHKKMVGGARGLMNQAPIGIDFGVGALKVLHINGGESPSLAAAACLPTPDDLLSDPVKRLAFQIEALPRLVRGIELKTRRAACAIPAGHAFCKHIQLQAEPGAPVSSLVRSAIAAQLGCDPSLLVYRHVEVGQVGKSSKTEVIGMAAARETVERLMGALKAARLEPVGMHSEYHAILRAFDSITRRAEDAALTSLYLDIGSGSTKVAIAHGRDLIFARTIEQGGRHLDQAVSRQLKLELAEARSQRLRMADLGRSHGAARQAAEAPAGTPGGMAMLAAAMRKQGAEAGKTFEAAATALMEDRRTGRLAPGLTPDLTAQPMMELRVDLSEPLEILTDEISMCLRYHESLFPSRKVDRAIFVGGEARHLALCQHIARSLKLPAQVGDPMASIARAGGEPCIGVDFKHSQPGWCVALGLCVSPTDL